jgi:hypothetical protein
MNWIFFEFFRLVRIVHAGDRDARNSSQFLALASERSARSDLVARGARSKPHNIEKLLIVTFVDTAFDASKLRLGHKIETWNEVWHERKFAEVQYHWKTRGQTVERRWGPPICENNDPERALVGRVSTSAKQGGS